MKANQATIVSGVLLLALALAFYMLVLSPKRSEVADLDAEAASLQGQIDEQQQVIAFGRQARKEFPRDYGRLVVLGKAVPEQADTASLLVELNSIAGASGVEFRGIALSQEGGDSAAAAATSATPAPSGAGAAPGSTTTAAPAAAAPAPATEASAANLPIGAVVGTAGLPTLPYDLSFKGGFFGIADYMGRLDSLVGFNGKGEDVRVNGRLMTVDGFSMSGGAPTANPLLEVNLMMTSYVTPSTQGLTAGAGPTGPAPSGVQATPASATVAP